MPSIRRDGENTPSRRSPGAFQRAASRLAALTRWLGGLPGALEQIKANLRQPLPRFPIPALRKWRLVRRYGMRVVKSLFH